MEKNKKGIIIGSCAVAALLLIGLVLFYFRSSSNEYIIKSGLELFAEKLDINTCDEKTYDTAKGINVAGTMSVKLSADDSMFESEEAALQGLMMTSIVNTLKLDYDISIKDNKYLMKFTPRIGETEITTVKAYFEEKGMYMYLNNIYDKYIQLLNTEDGVPIDMGGLELINYDDLFDSFNDEFIKLIKKKNIKETKEEITINDKLIEAKKKSVVITSSEMIVLFDKAFYSQYDKLLGEYLSDLYISDTEEFDITYSTYTTGLFNKVVATKFEIEIEDEKVELLFKNEKVSSVSLIALGEEVLRFEISEDSKEKRIRLVTKVHELNKFEIINFKKENKISYIIEGKTDEEENVGIELAMFSKVDKNKDKKKMELNVSVSNGETKGLDIKLIVDMTIKEGIKDIKEDVSNYKPLEEITEEEKKLMEENFNDLLNIFGE